MNHTNDFMEKGTIPKWLTGVLRVRMVVITWLLLISSSQLTLASDFLNYLGQPLLNADQERLASQWVRLETVETYFFVSANTNLLDEDVLTLNTPVASFVIFKQKIEEHGEGFYSWFGKTEDGSGNLNVVNNRGKITAAFFSSRLQFQIMPLGNGIHFAFIADGSKATNDDGDLGNAEIPEQKLRPKFPLNNPEPGGERAGNCKVRILICISDDALGSIGDVPGFVQSCIDVTNIAYNNSSIGFDVELARSQIVSYAESDDANTDLASFESTSDGVLDAIHDTRTYYDADLCVLIASNFDDWAGYANSIGGFGYYDAFCVMQWNNAVGTLTFPHELGHLYGARHDLYVDAGDTPYDYGHGYVNLPDLWRTIMAYNDKCVDAGTSCTRIQYFSNPAIDYLGDPTGISGSSDNESAHDNSDDNIGNLETSVADKSFPAETIDEDEAGNVIATNSITNSSTYYIESGANIIWRAGTEVILADGFIAYDGSTFRAYLDECTPLKAGDEETAALTEESPDAPKILKAYPNPLNDRTEITLKLSADATVSAWVSDIEGKKVAIISDEIFYNAGELRWEISLSSFAAGSYFVVASIDGKRHLLKLEKVR